MGNMRNIWRTLKSVLRCPKKLPCLEFSSNGIGITDLKQIANGFNQYFCYNHDNVSHALALSIRYFGNDFNNYLQNSNSSTFFTDRCRGNYSGIYNKLRDFAAEKVQVMMESNQIILANK